MAQISEVKSLSRRKFLRTTGLTGTALFLGFYFPASAKAAIIISGAGLDNIEVEMNAWIIIDTAGKVTVVDHRAEMGQGSYQSVPQIVAEELEVDINDIHIIFAQGNKDKYGSQITGGSSTIRGSYKNLLNLGASAREMLIQAAATKWAVPVSECYAEKGHVYHKSSGKKFHYGELVVDASKLPVPQNLQLKKPSEYKLIRKPLHRRDTPLKTNGSAVFGLDNRRHLPLPERFSDTNNQCDEHSDFGDFWECSLGESRSGPEALLAQPQQPQRRSSHYVLSQSCCVGQPGTRDLLHFQAVLRRLSCSEISQRAVGLRQGRPAQGGRDVLAPCGFLQRL
jgi:hypothetical protein